MKTIKRIIHKLLELFYGCFYLFSACTLVLFLGAILMFVLRKLDIQGTKQDIIILSYVTIIAIYTVVKVFFWLRKLCRKLRSLYDRHFRKDTTTNTI